ncbi:MAG: class I SAM-dependent methyltransferase [Pseudomonadota bacterium]
MSFDPLIRELSPTVPGFTNPKVLGLLYSLVIAHRPRTIVEIGSFMGRSSCVLSSALAALDGEDRKLFCVDLFDVVIDQPYLSLPLIRHILEYAGDQKGLYTDLERISTISDCFDVTVSRFPRMERIVTKVTANSGDDWTGNVGSVDFSYIDGDHSYQAVRRDCLKVLSCASENHMMAFDDYSTQFPGVVRFVEELRESPGVTFVAFEHPDIAFTIARPRDVISALGG